MLRDDEKDSDLEQLAGKLKDALAGLDSESASPDSTDDLELE